MWCGNEVQESRFANSRVQAMRKVVYARSRKTIQASVEMQEFPEYIQRLPGSCYPGMLADVRNGEFVFPRVAARRRRIKCAFGAGPRMRG